MYNKGKYMNLELRNSHITITGNLTNDKDFHSLKTAIEGLLADYKTLVLEFHDTLVINSSLIGYLVNVVHQKGIQVNIHTANDTLYELIDYLGMHDIFNLKKI